MMNTGVNQDREISRSIRRVLVRHWIDLGRLSLVVARRLVAIRTVGAAANGSAFGTN